MDSLLERLLGFSSEKIKPLRVSIKKHVLGALARVSFRIPRRLKHSLGFEFLEVFGTRELLSNMKASKNLVGVSRHSQFIVHPSSSGRIVITRKTRRNRLIFVYGSLSPLIWVPAVTELLRSPGWQLIIGGSDFSFPRQLDARYPRRTAKELHEIERIAKHNNIQAVWVENLDESKPEYRPIPTGLVPDKYNSPLVRKLNFGDFPKPESSEVALCAQRNRPGKQYSERRVLERLARGPWSEFTTLVLEPVSLRSFQKLLRNHRFTFCAHGGGFDPSPKAFEALLAGSIPIIKKSATSAAYEELPVVFVDDWTESAISREVLLEEYERIVAQRDYWERVREHLSMERWLDRFSQRYGSVS